MSSILPDRAHNVKWETGTLVLGDSRAGTQGSSTSGEWITGIHRTRHI